MLGAATTVLLLSLGAPPDSGFIDVPWTWQVRTSGETEWVPYNIGLYERRQWTPTTWFRVVVDIPPSLRGGPLSLSLGSWVCPHAIYVDGIEVAVNEGYARAQLTVLEEATADGQVAIEVRTTQDPWVAKYGYDGRFAGGPLYLGRDAVVQRLAETEWSAVELRYLAPPLIVAIICWLVAAFHFWLYRRRREFSAYLWYATTLVFVGAWMFGRAAPLIGVQDSMELMNRWAFAASKLSVAAGIQSIVVQFYRRQPSWPWRVLQALLVIPGVALVVVGAPAYVLLQSPINEVLMAVCIVGEAGLVLYAATFDRTARIVLIGFLMVLGAVGLQMAAQAGLIAWLPNWVMTFALLPLMLSMGVALSEQFAGSLDDLDARIKRRARAQVPAATEVVENLDTSAIPAETRVGPYRVVAGLGSGAMGVVYRAHDTRLDRDVALKLVQPEADQDSLDAARALLEREAKAMARVTHPNLATIFDVGRHGDEIYFAMELIKGQSAELWLADGQPPRLILEMFMDAGLGLSALHAEGLVHRDFKPANVMVAYDGRVLLVDFGIARQTDDGQADSGEDASSPSPDDGSQRSVRAGTPAYMAPEQYRGQPATGRSDQFSFCVALYEALFGAHPFHGGKAARRARRLRAMLRGEVTAPVTCQDLDELRQAILRGLAAEPSDRYASMSDLLAMLERTAPRG